ncbi:MAG TPA: rod shape-determining protein MreC [Kofleriaceae bacterium]|nr:rod shape-determining protein MreC [Kofleriaceae bacterium]
MTLRHRLVDWLLVALLIVLPALVLRASLSRGTTSPLDRALLRITAPLEAGVSWVVEGIGGMWERYVALVDIEKENRELRADNDELRKQLATTSRRAFDVEALEDLATVKRKTPADTLGARVIGAPLSPQFRVLRLRIDRGEREVAPGMPVVAGGGPVGRVDKVYGDYADVTLISDPSSSIEVVIPRTGGRGMLTGLGRPDSYACTIEWLERDSAAAGNAKIEVGDDVVTSGLGASFPPGLVVGKIVKVAHDDGMFQRAEVEPAVDVSRVRAALVLLAPPPPPDPDAKVKKKSEPAFGGRAL